MSRLRSLQDFISAGLETIVECAGCRRQVRADPRDLLAGIRVKWRHDLRYQGSKLRCTVCKHRGARLAPAPKLAGPLDCEEFQADIEAMWERVTVHTEEAALFEVGKKYRFKIGIADDVWDSLETVIAIDGSLVKLEGPGGVRIVNTVAPSFHSAEPMPDGPVEPFDIKINLSDKTGEPSQ